MATLQKCDTIHYIIKANSEIPLGISRTYVVDKWNIIMVLHVC